MPSLSPPLRLSHVLLSSSRISKCWPRLFSSLPCQKCQVLASASSDLLIHAPVRGAETAPGERQRERSRRIVTLRREHIFRRLLYWLDCFQLKLKSFHMVQICKLLPPIWQAAESGASLALAIGIDDCDCLGVDHRATSADDIFLRASTHRGSH